MSDKTPAQRVQAIFDEAVGADLSSWEKFEFLQDIKKWPRLTDKQESILCGIEKRIFGEEQE
jgi:hypothetical protein